MLFDKYELKKPIKVNLQLFAEDPEDEEIEDAGLVSESEDEGEEDASESTENEDSGEEVEEPEDESGEDVTEEEPEKPAKDKKTAAIIKAKQENKKLRDELAKYRRAEEEKKLQEQKEKQKQKYIDSGYTEEEAAERAEEKAKMAKLERDLRLFRYESQAEKLSKKYPDIYEHLDKLIDLSEKTGWPLEKVCKAELQEASEFDIKTRTEQEQLLRRQKAEKKKIETGASKKTQEEVKLGTADERVYQQMKQSPRYKGLTRKKYLEILKDYEE